MARGNALISRASLRRTGAALVGVAFACACASSGGGDAEEKERKKTVILTTEYDDLRVGRDAAKDAIAQFGLLDDAELTAYVNEIGRKLLRGVPRGSFQYRFHVVDETEPNAFALPGGQIFISRGLLALVNNEDELACTMGHEITHVAHRHAAELQALAKNSNPLAAAFNGAALMASYSRDAERDADQGGQILCAAAGYSPMGMSTFLRSLDRRQRMRLGYLRGTGYYDSHPGASERAAANAIRANEIRWQRDPSIGDPRRAVLDKTDGIPVGQRPGTGLFRGDLFLHPELGFKLRFPPDWRTSNTAKAVGAFSPQGDALVYLTAELPPGDVEQVAKDWLAKERDGQSIDLLEAVRVRLGSIEGVRMTVSGGSGAGGLTAMVTFFPYAGSTWQIIGVTPSFRFTKNKGRLLTPSRTFASLEPGDMDGIRSMRMRVVKAEIGEDLDRLSARTGNAWSVLETAVNNGIFSDQGLKLGELMKIARSERFEPAKAKAEKP